MTIIAPEFKTCSVCGSTHEYYVLHSTNSFGSPDLDLRPPQMRRSTMGQWVDECPDCGYVASDITDPCEVSVDFLKSKEYRTCDGLGFKSKLASRFFRFYKLNLKSNNTKRAFYAALHAAWACDDEEDNANSKNCRNLALNLVDQLIEDDPESRDNLLLMKADLLRRTGHFDELITEYENIHFEKEIMNKVLAFELELAHKKDTACYTVSDAVEKSTS